MRHEALKLYTIRGLKITKIHRGIKFRETAWLKKYIDLNTTLRTAATSDFEKDLYKLMNNAVFGKTMENIEKRVDVKLVSNKVKAAKLSNKINFNRCVVFNENLVGINMNKL